MSSRTHLIRQRDEFSIEQSEAITETSHSNVEGRTTDFIHINQPAEPKCTQLDPQEFQLSLGFPFAHLRGNWEVLKVIVTNHLQAMRKHCRNKGNKGRIKNLPTADLLRGKSFFTMERGNFCSGLKICLLPVQFPLRRPTVICLRIAMTTAVHLSHPKHGTSCFLQHCWNI